MKKLQSRLQSMQQSIFLQWQTQCGVVQQGTTASSNASHDTMHPEQQYPALMITTASNKPGENDQRCSEKHSGIGSPARRSGNNIYCTVPVVMPRRSLHSTANSSTLSSLSMEDLQTSLQTVCHPGRQHLLGVPHIAYMTCHRRSIARPPLSFAPVPSRLTSCVCLNFRSCLRMATWLPMWTCSDISTCTQLRCSPVL